MKKRYLKDIFVDEDEKKKNICFYSIVIAVLSLLCIVFTLLSYHASRTKYITYQEDSDIDYKVYLRENDFFGEKYLEKDQKYIASLIDYIYAEFHYNMNINNPNIHYNYQYRVEADVSVKEKNSSNSFYLTHFKVS